MIYDLTSDLAEWLAADHMGTQANKLRCAAYCAMDEGVTVAEFVAACVALGVTAGTARNRWHEVCRQEAAA
jgi:hypothetical protein